MQVNAKQVNGIQANNTSIDQLQIKETSTIKSTFKSTMNGTSIIQSQINPSPPKNSQIKEPAKEETRNVNGLSENENKKTIGGSSPANPAAAPATEAQKSADTTALPKSTANSRADPAKDTSVIKNSLKIKFKTDSTIRPKSENNPNGDHTSSGTVAGANAPSSPTTSESRPAEYKKNAAPRSGDSTSISKSPATRKGSESAQKTIATVASKTQKAQEIRYQRIANKNRLAENSKKKAALARARER